MFVNEPDGDHIFNLEFTKITGLRNMGALEVKELVSSTVYIFGGKIEVLVSIQLRQQYAAKYLIKCKNSQKSR